MRRCPGEPGGYRAWRWRPRIRRGGRHPRYSENRSEPVHEEGRITGRVGKEVTNSARSPPFQTREMGKRRAAVIRGRGAGIVDLVEEVGERRPFRGSPPTRQARRGSCVLRGVSCLLLLCSAPKMVQLDGADPSDAASRGDDECACSALVGYAGRFGWDDHRAGGREHVVGVADEAAFKEDGKPGSSRGFAH